jgi:hypothetical protein
MLVSVVSTRTLYKVAVDEANESWTPVDSVEFPVGKPPVCTVFRADGQRAYVSTMMDGIVRPAGTPIAMPARTSVRLSLRII